MAEQQEASGDAMTTRIGQAVILHRGGDREEARNRFAALWEELDESGDLFHRCTVAHYMADTQEDPGAELEWDLRALAAADTLTQEQVEWGSTLSRCVPSTLRSTSTSRRTTTSSVTAPPPGVSWTAPGGWWGRWTTMSTAPGSGPPSTGWSGS